MQPKYTHNKSSIIKITEDAKRKSRQRLIGSIVLLFFALVVLLNVTAKVKPILINPEVIEIKNSSGPTLTLKNSRAASQPVIAVASAPITAFKAVVSSMPKAAKPLLPHVKAKIKAIDPADILNGTDTDLNIDIEVPQVANHSYLQFGALSSTAKASQLQQLLASNGIKASVTPIATANGTLYRLRAGPFSHSDAENKLAQMSSAGYNGIITGN